MLVPTKLSNKDENCLNRFGDYLKRTGMDHKQYQYDGVRWCYINETRPDPPENIRGGFIADEMGLGKTIVMIGLFVTNLLPRTLIVLPPALIDQWYTQIYKTTGHCSLIFHGQTKKKISLKQLNNAYIVLTTYGAISTDAKSQKKTILHEVQWSRIVFDEAHHLRNKKTGINRGAFMLQSPIRWLVSGTPVQNSKHDFYTLCDAVKMPIGFYTSNANLPTIAKCFILKRTKKQVGIMIPDVNIHTSPVKWQNKKEMELSELIHSALKFSKVKPKMSLQIRMLPLLTKAKQSCTLPRLMINNFNKMVKAGIIQGFSQFEEALNHSSKLDYVLQTILERKNNNKGKLIFCHYRDEIDEISKRLTNGGMSVATLDGRDSQTLRAEILREKFDVLILQIQTGCEGLNLQENYSEIYFVTPHWNPSVEDQAIARCHRIGQKNDVHVFRFYMDGFTNEEKDEDGKIISTVSIDNYVTSVQDNKRILATKCIECEPTEQKQRTKTEKTEKRDKPEKYKKNKKEIMHKILLVNV
jgi:SNF2 family DNA or RNA helicase